MAVAQWVRRWSSGHRVVQVEGSSPDGDMYQVFVSSMIFQVSFFCSFFYFSDIVILCGRPNSCCQQNLKCFDMHLLSSGLFS